MFDNLSERLERSFKILKGEGKITEINVAETLKDVRKALLDADVNYKVAKSFTDTVKEKALGQNVLTAVKPSQLMVKIVHDELTQLMGGETAEINIDSKPAVILMSGLQGSGKTTFSGKLARMLKTKKNRKPLLVACDVYRPALQPSSPHFEITPDCAATSILLRRLRALSIAPPTALPTSSGLPFVWMLFTTFISI